MKCLLLGFVMTMMATRFGSPQAAPAPHWAVAVFPSGHEFTLEVAADDESRAHGYMGRTKVGPREGMIFVFEEDGRHAFWMKDCQVSLDMIWLDKDFRVVWVAARQHPCPPTGECPSTEPPSPARFVLEFAEGTAAAESLRAGDSVVVLSDPALR